MHFDEIYIIYMHMLHTDEFKHTHVYIYIYIYIYIYRCVRVCMRMLTRVQLSVYAWVLDCMSLRGYMSLFLIWYTKCIQNSEDPWSYRWVKDQPSKSQSRWQLLWTYSYLYVRLHQPQLSWTSTPLKNDDGVFTQTSRMRQNVNF